MANHDPSVILFNVIYEDSDRILALPKDKTVVDLKNAICDGFGVPFHEQILNCWHAVPPSDDTKLESCCSLYDINFLILERDKIEDESIPDDADACSAALSFVEHFMNNYEQCNLLLHITSLQDAIKEACLRSRNERKILMLYFHNATSKFSGEFCKNMCTPEVREIMDHFFLLGWNVEDVKYHKALKAALHTNNLTELYKFIDKKSCAVFLIVPIQNDITLFCCIQKGKFSDFLTSLKQAVDVLNHEKEVEEDLENCSVEEETCLGSEKFQQLMLDCLGDRDYDSFDSNEHQCLKDKIAFALYGAPQDENGYDRKQKKSVDSLFKTILTESNQVSKWKNRVIVSFIYNCLEPLPEEKLKRKEEYKDYNPHTDTTPVPIFVLRRCKKSDNPCRIFIDNTGRVYRSWESYLTQNKLHPCHMILPKDGRYAADKEGRVLLERHLSPECGITPKILKGTDIASTVAGIGSGGVFLLAVIPAVTVAPAALIAAGATGIGVGIYSLGRSAYTLYDRRGHKETLSFWNAQARGAYINIVAGTLGFVGAGANMAIAQLATKGVNIGQGATAALSGINIANLAAGGAGIFNSGYDLFDQWFNENQTPSRLAMLQLSCSILFFGHAVYSFKMGATVVEEAQTNALKDIQDSMRSNRHRKTFNKLLKETIRRNDGNVSKGRAEVISTIRNLSNMDDVFAVLTRANKDMNKNDVKFSAENGQIKLNGHSINMLEFTQMDRNERLSFLSELPNQTAVEPTGSQVNSMTSHLRSLVVDINVDQLSRLAFNLLKIFGNVEESIKDKILHALFELVDYLKIQYYNCWKVLDRFFPNVDKYFRLFKMIVGFIQKFIDNKEHEFQKWRQDGSNVDEKPAFSDVHLDQAQRTLQFLNQAMGVYFIGSNLTSAALLEIVEYFYAWFTKKMYDFEENRERRKQRSANSTEAAKSVECTVCKGYYYSR